MAVTINLASGDKNITLSKVERPINVSKVTRQISLTHVGGRGAQGETGATGATGPANSLSIGTVTTGAPSAATITGDAPSQTLNLTLEQGEPGTDGTNGADGTDGNGWTGATYSASTGKVTFTSDDGLGFVTGDLRGSDGTNGTNGSDGAAATVAVGTTSTLSPGSSATVTNSGSSSAATLNFGIPQGAVWYTGAGTPSTTHNDGDLYLNTSNGDVYKQTSGAWGSSIANLTGPTGSAGSASGSDTQVQFNDGGSFAGDTGLTYNKTTNVLTASGGFSGNSSTATKLAAARTIGGVSFDGSANINLPGVNTSGTQNTTGNASTATKLATARNINGVAFDGSADVTVADSTKQPIVVQVTSTTARTTAAKVGTTTGGSYVPTTGDIALVTFTLGISATSPTLAIDGGSAIGLYIDTVAVSAAVLSTGSSSAPIPLMYDGTHWQLLGGSHLNTNTTYSSMSVSEGETGTATSARSLQANYLKSIIIYHADNEISSYLSTMNAGNTYGWL